MFYYYVHYYAVSAMVLAGDEHYAKWYPQIRDALITPSRATVLAKSWLYRTAHLWLLCTRCRHSSPG